MMLTNPIHDFLRRARSPAKQCKVKELNYLEAELIMMEEEIINLNKNGALPGDIGFLIQKIDALKNAVKGKRNDLADKQIPIPTKMINARADKTQ